jgi:glycosyltransferase involved in cell wall biosynthesis
MLKKKIYIFHPHSSIGGADLSISRLINNLNPKKFEIVFLCLKKLNINYYLNRKIKTISFPYNRTLRAVLSIRNFIKQDFDENKYEKHIFISNQNFANVLSFLILFRFKNIKQILIERNHIDEFKNQNKLSLKNYVILLLMKRLYKYADLIIGISKKLSKDLSAFVSAKVITIYNPSYDLSILSKSKKKVKKVFANKNIILNIARFEEQKDHMTLLRAYKLVLKKIKCNLILVGYGSKLNQIKKYIQKNKLDKHVSIYTKIKNPYPFFRIAKLFVLTSKYEGFGNVLVEAAMFGIPIVSSNCDSGPSEILKNGKGGDIFEVGNYQKLSRLIIANLMKKNKDKINFMKKRILEFELKIIINKYEKILDRI